MGRDIILQFYRDNERKESMFRMGREQIFEPLVADKKSGSELLSVNLLAKDAPEYATTSFMPGMVYIFLYPLRDGAAGKYRFIDYIPTVFCTGSGRGILNGINLNFLTPEKRAYFINSIWNTDSDLYYDNVYTDGAVRFVNERLATALRSGLDDFIRFENSYLKMDISKAMRSYDMSKVASVRIVGYYLWQYLPFLQMPESIRGADLHAIQSMVCSASDDGGRQDA